MSEIYYSYFDSPIGRLLMFARDGKLTNLEFEEEQIKPIDQKWISDDDQPVFIQTGNALTRYFNGEPETFSDLPLAPFGTSFQQRIWNALRGIPYGESATYSELADLIDNPKAVRAVGGAVGRNPIGIIIPCHRILGKDRSLTGFGGGLPAKRYLLKLESIAFVDKGIEHVTPKRLKINTK